MPGPVIKDCFDSSLGLSAAYSKKKPPMITSLQSCKHSPLCPKKTAPARFKSHKGKPAKTTHIGISAALLQFRANEGNINPIKACRHEIMKTAKITGPATYHRCIKDLNEYVYINYVPKRNRNQKSVIYFLV